MGKKSIPKELWETYRAMSVDVGRANKFLKETACMNQEFRIALADCETIKELFKEDKEFVDFMNDVVIPFYQKQGWAHWGRDVVTDLGFALANQQRRTLKVKNILEMEVKHK
ncbi:hypothetical protein ES702_02565 [subsurface metagenome]